MSDFKRELEELLLKYNATVYMEVPEDADIEDIGKKSIFRALLNSSDIYLGVAKYDGAEGFDLIISEDEDE